MHAANTEAICTPLQVQKLLLSPSVQEGGVGGGASSTLGLSSSFVILFQNCLNLEMVQTNAGSLTTPSRTASVKCQKQWSTEQKKRGKHLDLQCKICQ